LEALIERVKPPVPLGQHRLLTTPFRYPPLRSGSRFTAADQRELFYGARGLGTVLAERAFHALRFLDGSSLPAEKVIQRQQTSFQVEITVERGLQLHHCLSTAQLAAVTDPCSYQASQALGLQLRHLQVKAFEVPSPRAALEPPCVGSHPRGTNLVLYERCSAAWEEELLGDLMHWPAASAEPAVLEILDLASSSRSLELLIGAFCTERDGRSLGLLLEY
jgi:hypothetical protein